MVLHNRIQVSNEVLLRPEFMNYNTPLNDIPVKISLPAFSRQVYLNSLPGFYAVTNTRFRQYPFVGPPNHHTVARSPSTGYLLSF